MASAPGNRVLAFARDAATERALRAGFANRDARVRRARYAAALRALAAEPAAALVAVDIDGVSDPDAAAAGIASVCAPGTAIVAIGREDAGHFARALLAGGVADYLVKPVTAAAAREAAAAALEEAPERAYAGRVLAICGSAGCGSSTLAAAMARTVAARGLEAAAVDFDPLSGKLPALFGAAPAPGLAVALSTLARGAPGDGDEDDEEEDLGARLDALCAPAGDGVSLVAYTAAGPPPPARAAAARALLDRFANRAHTVFAVGMKGPETRLEVLEGADSRIVLFEPTLPSIVFAARTLALLGKERPAILAESRPRMRASALSRAQIRYALADRRPDLALPFDPALAEGPRGGGALGGKAYRAALRRAIELTVEAI